jgi:hypothetical protein
VKQALPTGIAPWHRESYANFLRERLPALLARRLPLNAYSVEASGEHARIELDVDTTHLVIESVPWPDAEGVFHLDGSERIVLPVADNRELDKAAIRCVGEQLYEFVEPRIGEAPTGMAWTDELLASWLPIDRWILDFLEPADSGGTVQPVDNLNWLARIEHLRRLRIEHVRRPGARPGEDERVELPGQLGRVCPIMKPEGPNFQIIHSLARGAVIRDGRIETVNDSPEMMLSVTAAAIPFLSFDDANRALMGANMMRQWLPPAEPEPALVVAGTEPDAPELWCGRNLLTAFVSWGVDTFEDGLLISRSCADGFGYTDPLEPGDKLSNRHGTKGVVSRILPNGEMPHLADGTPVDLVFSFIGLHTRMNFGQLKEAVLGRVANRRGERMVAPPIGAPDDEALRRHLRENGLPESGMEVLHEGKDGPALERPSTVGYVYWGLTRHRPRTKLHVHPGGPANRQGELEYYVLRDLGAFGLIAETFNTRSLRSGSSPLANPTTLPLPLPRATPPTPAFADLRGRLADLGIKAELRDHTVAFGETTAPNGLELAVPLPHPWLPERSIQAVGLHPELAEFRALEQANEHIRRVLAQHAPEKLTDRARRTLETRLGAYAKVLLPTDAMRFGEPIAFSGRTVIAPAKSLSVEQVGLPEPLAWGLFGPLLPEERKTEEALDRLMAESWVIVNRAPSLNPTTMVAFRPVRVPGSVIRLCISTCPLLNADFDGDQVAVFLPLTAEGQAEARDRLSVAAHVRRDASVLAQLCPNHEAQWGLAWLGLSPAGRQQVNAQLPEPLVPATGLVDAATIATAVEAVRERHGLEAALGAVERLTELGLAAARRSGASLNPFAGTTAPRPRRPEPLAVGTWFEQADDLADQLLCRDDYESPDLGTQVLAVKSGARGSAQQLLAGFVGGVIVDARSDLLYIPHGRIAGYTANEVFVHTVGAHRGLWQVIAQCDRLGQEARQSHQPGSHDVLARAMRSRCPGTVFARAASRGEVDPLVDLDTRLFVGLPVE